MGRRRKMEIFKLTVCFQKANWLVAKAEVVFSLNFNNSGAIIVSLYYLKKTYSDVVAQSTKI